MPIYEFECTQCHHVFEELMKMSDPNPGACPACGKGPVQKLMSRSGFILKGGGFYTNEYPSAARQAGHQAEGGAPAKTAEKAGPTPAPTVAGKAESPAETKSPALSEPASAGTAESKGSAAAGTGAAGAPV